MALGAHGKATDGNRSEDLHGTKILIIEDDLFVAMDLGDTLRSAGAEIIGPVSSTSRAMKLLNYDRVDAAVLDISLNQEFVFPLADVLAEANIPFLFASGCDPDIIPAKFARIPLCAKPVEPARIVSILSGLFDESIR